MSQKLSPIIIPSEFLRSTRESGYRGTAQALSELIDNSIEAGAKHVDVRTIPNPSEVAASGDANTKASELLVIDDGIGMDANTLANALAFGGSSRFGSRSGLGRFGMGLPNASLSQARRLEVFSWQDNHRPFHNVLDIDEVVEKEATSLAYPKPMDLPAAYASPTQGKSGTVVVWKNLDRMDLGGKVLPLLPRLHSEFGRIFRYYLTGQKGLKLTIGGVDVKPIDPLYLLPESVEEGDKIAEQFGAPAEVMIPLPDQPGKSAKAYVTCSILPAEWQFAWRHNTNAAQEAKAKRHLAETVGISIVREQREIGIIKNPYHARHWTDAWYRVEVRFSPELDEVFGVTHTKQAIRMEPGSPAYSYLEGVVVPRVQQMRDIIVKRRAILMPKPAAKTPAMAANAGVMEAKPRSSAPAFGRFDGDVEVLMEPGSGRKGPRLNSKHPYAAVYDAMPNECRAAVNTLLKAAAGLSPDALKEFGKLLGGTLTKTTRSPKAENLLKTQNS